MRVIVTGGAGYVGSVIVQHLLRTGHSVVVVDNLSQGHRENVPEEVRFIEADVANLAEVLSASDKIDALIHCASYIQVGESMHMPAKYWQNNVIQTIQLLDAVVSLGVKKLVFSSTAAVYGNPSQVPISEDAVTKPTNPYGMTKLADDMAISNYAAAYGIAACSLRYFNVAGAEVSYGERHQTETHIIPLALKAAAEDKPFTIFGNDYDTPDGTCVRDYIHISDLADAHLLALENLQSGEHSIYNLGNGEGYSNKQVVACVEQITGKKLKLEYGPRRVGDPATLVATSDKARKQLGWKPQKTSLDEIVQDAWNFYTLPK
jgi:UDP-glucose 4-epimerase